MIKPLRSFATHDPSELRRASRDLVDFSAMATSHSGVHQVRIVNISLFGLMGRVSTPLLPGENLLLDLPHVRRIESVVRWAEDGRIGVEFASPVAAEQYSAMLSFMPKRPLR